MSEKDPPPPLTDDSVDELFSAVASTKQKDKLKEPSAPAAPRAAQTFRGVSKKGLTIALIALVIGVLAWGFLRLGRTPPPPPQKALVPSLTTTETSPEITPMSEPPRTPIERQMRVPVTPPAFIAPRDNEPRPVPPQALPPPPPPPPPLEDRDRIDPRDDELQQPHDDPQQPQAEPAPEAQLPQEN
jgi:hypothetical protein